MIYTVTFERIGRRHDLPAQQFIAADAEGLAEQVHCFARRHLMSSDIVVHVDLEAMKGSIGFGRHGRFSIAEEAA